MFKSPAVSFERIWNEYSGHDSFNADSTRFVWRRASLDCRVPMTKVFLTEGLAAAWDDIGGGGAAILMLMQGNEKNRFRALVSIWIELRDQDTNLLIIRRGGETALMICIYKQEARAIRVIFWDL